MELYGILSKKGEGKTLIAGHRGSPGGNVPCNTIPAFNAALMGGADIIELDVSKSRDGRLYVFHPGMEKPHAKSFRLISSKKSSAVDKMRFRNQDEVITSYRVNTFEETLLFLKDKCLVNVDKFWTAPKEISEMIRKCGMEKQVIIKTSDNERHIANVMKFAPDLMFMPVISKRDEICGRLLNEKINLIGAEVLFKTEEEPVCSDEYIRGMHERGLLLWGNAIVYNEKAVISAGHTDDAAVAGDPDKGWGWFVKKGFDIIQTDYVPLLKKYISEQF